MPLRKKPAEARWTGLLSWGLKVGCQSAKATHMSDSHARAIMGATLLWQSKHGELRITSTAGLHAPPPSPQPGRAAQQPAPQEWLQPGIKTGGHTQASSLCSCRDNGSMCVGVGGGDPSGCHCRLCPPAVMRGTRMTHPEPERMRSSDGTSPARSLESSHPFALLLADLAAQVQSLAFAARVSPGHGDAVRPRVWYLTAYRLDK